MLTFDEFRAVNNREKAREAEENKTESATSTGDPAGTKKKKSGTKVIKKSNSKKSGSNASNTTPSADDGVSKKKRSFFGEILDGMGDFLEVQQMQSLYVLLIVIDTFVSLAEMYASCDANFQGNSYNVNRNILVRLLNSFSTFTTVFFIVEIVATLLVFRLAFFSHWGYLLDILTTTAQILLERYGYGKVTRLLHIFRFWRMARLLNSMVGAEKEAHEKTTLLLEASEVEVKRLQLDVSNLTNDITKEKEARNAIEDMLQNYKEEVDTLNEALKIAAMDIAEVAQADDDFALSEDGDEGTIDVDDDSARHKHDDEDDGFVDAASSRYSKSANKGTIMRAVMEDNISINNNSIGGTSTGTATQSAASSVPATFLVHEDGTFEQK
mmetsp:Transcript_2267/g.3573  ORF Transcript_2267/g.3573 Transcript_2267/m.3573 type:complete len:383 (+) Transcript_2267:55-1203(+)